MFPYTRQLPRASLFYNSASGFIKAIRVNYENLLKSENDNRIRTEIEDTLAKLEDMDSRELESIHKFLGFDSMVCVELINVGEDTSFILPMRNELLKEWGNKANIPAFDVGAEDCSPVIEYDSSKINIDKLVRDIRASLTKHNPGAQVGLISY